MGSFGAIYVGGKTKKLFSTGFLEDYKSDIGPAISPLLKVVE